MYIYMVNNAEYMVSGMVCIYIYIYTYVYTYYLCMVNNLEYLVYEGASSFRYYPEPWADPKSRSPFRP